MPLFGSNFAQGFIKGVAESVDESLKNDMDRTFKRADRAADYHIRRKAADQERYDAEMRDVENLLKSFAAFTGGDLDKAAQLYKAGGGNVEGAKVFLSTLDGARQKLGNEFDVTKAVTFAETQAGELGMADYLGNLVRRPRDFIAASLPDTTTGGVGLYRAFQPGESIRKDITEQVEQAIPTTATDFTEAEIGTATIDYGKLPTAKEYALEMEAKDVSLQAAKAQLNKTIKENMQMGSLDDSAVYKSFGEMVKTGVSAAGIAATVDANGIVSFDPPDSEAKAKSVAGAYSRALKAVTEEAVRTNSLNMPGMRNTLKTIANSANIHSPAGVATPGNMDVGGLYFYGGTPQEPESTILWLNPAYDQDAGPQEGVNFIVIGKPRRV